MTIQTETSSALPLQRTAVTRAPESPTRRAIRRFRRHRLAMTGVVIIVLLVVASLLGSQSAALEQNLKAMNEPPSTTHLLGTDRIGRDILARTLVGGRISLSVGLVAVVFSTSIGIVAGALAGYYRGWLDHLIMRVVDVVLSFPVIVLLLCGLTRGPKHFQRDGDDWAAHLAGALPDHARAISGAARTSLCGSRSLPRRL
ncbi:MAG: hypothetical protein R2867_35845 [Caldilineaceae bacterium]